ncbi:glycosyltransferase [Hydrogenimonas sp.]
MTKIAIFLNLPLYEGLIHDVVTVRFAQALANSGARVKVFYSGYKNIENIMDYYDLNDNPRLIFIGCKRLKITSPVKLSSSLVTKSDMALKLINLIKQKSCDLVFTNDDSLLFLSRIAKLYDRPFFFEAHDIPKTIPTSVTKVLSTTKALKEKIEQKHPSHSPVTPLLLSPNRENFTPTTYRAPEDLRTLIYTGKLTKERGAFLILEAMKILSPDYRALLFGGTPRQVAYARHYAQKLGISDRVEFFGYLPISELEQKLSTIGGLQIVPPPDNERYRYIAHTKIFDALGRGKLIVASNLPSIREVTEENAFYFIPGDAVSLAKTVKTVSSLTVSEVNALIARMATRFNTLSYRNRAKKFLDFFEETRA